MKNFILSNSLESLDKSLVGLSSFILVFDSSIEGREEKLRLQLESNYIENCSLFISLFANQNSLEDMVDDYLMVSDRGLFFPTISISYAEIYELSSIIKTWEQGKVKNVLLISASNRIANLILDSL